MTAFLEVALYGIGAASGLCTCLASAFSATTKTAPGRCGLAGTAVVFALVAAVLILAAGDLR